MVPAHPISVRFEPAVSARLAHYTQRHPGTSASAAVNRFVDEGLRMHEHPGVFFRSGPAGRRAVLVGGPDVWEVVRAVRDARRGEPELDQEGLLGLVADNNGVPRMMLNTALAYRAAFPDEIDGAVAEGDRVAAEELAGWLRTRELLSS